MTRDSRWGRRCSAIVAVATFVSASMVPPALAGKPVTEPLPIGETFLADPGLACPTAIAPEGVRSTTVGGNAVITSFDNGAFIITGRHIDEVTNVATGKSVINDLNGRVVSIPRKDGSTVLWLSGRQGFIFFPGDVGPGDDTTGRSYLFTGHVRIVYGAAGSVVSFHSTGRRQDTCAMIA